MPIMGANIPFFPPEWMRRPRSRGDLEGIGLLFLTVVTLTVAAFFSFSALRGNSPAPEPAKTEFMLANFSFNCRANDLRKNYTHLIVTISSQDVDIEKVRKRL